jgi:glycerol-3-phosphate acyltransferase PlsX
VNVATTDQSNIRIAIDAMGGDFAPVNVLSGGLDALRETSNRFEVVFVGPRETITTALAKLPHDGMNYSVSHASQVIDMHDGATAALKQKKDSSIAVGMTMHKNGEVQAFVSAGHTGAMMSASTLILGRIEGVSRPTIGTFFPSEHGVALLVDAGANVDCKPLHLLEFGIMGSIYTSEMMGIASPTVGLLNIGEEDSKGNDIVKEAYALLKASKLNFIGNVEGRDILPGKANVVVCDGFVGNILLKFGESVPSFLKTRLKAFASQSIVGSLMGLLMKGTLRGALRSLDYEEFGGVPVLGVNGVSIIGHGKSTPKAIKNMILKAEEMIRHNINGRIGEAIASLK